MTAGVQPHKTCIRTEQLGNGQIHVPYFPDVSRNPVNYFEESARILNVSLPWGESDNRGWQGSAQNSVWVTGVPRGGACDISLPVKPARRPTHAGQVGLRETAAWRTSMTSSIFIFYFFFDNLFCHQWKHCISKFCVFFCLFFCSFRIWILSPSYHHITHNNMYFCEMHACTVHILAKGSELSVCYLQHTVEQEVVQALNQQHFVRDVHIGCCGETNPWPYGYEMVPQTTHSP